MVLLPRVLPWAYEADTLSGYLLFYAIFFMFLFRREFWVMCGVGYFFVGVIMLLPRVLSCAYEADILSGYLLFYASFFMFLFRREFFVMCGVGYFLGVL